MWEIHALAIVGELRSRAAMRKMGRLEIDILYARAKAKLWDKIERLQKLKNEGPLKIVDFGTRRRHSYLWQRWCVEALKAGLGDAFVGTSNVLMAMELSIEAIGTNAHELSMVYAAMAAPDEQAMKDARYKVLLDWASIYGGNLLVTLPDTYGTTNFLRDAPDWVANWTGARPDSKEPIAAGDELIAYWAAHGQDPKTKLLILSDGMDIVSIETCFHHFLGRARTSFGWGTNATNDFRGCMPSGGHALDPISLVCKVAKANGRGAVKLSDNLSKKTGKAEDIELYIKTYGTDGMANKAVDV
jgi:nicotinate phosphoribosyltransferase